MNNGPALRRPALLAPIDAALEHVTAGKAISDEAAHEARKSLKRARAALRLVRPALGETTYRRENAALRDASRAISQLRDAKAQMDAFAAVSRYAKRWPRRELAKLNARLRAELGRTGNEIRGSAGDIPNAARLIEQSRCRFTGMLDAAVEENDVEAALARMYAQARRAYAAARRRREPEVLHEWRKKTKYLSNAIRLTDNGACGHLGALAKRTERLADWLGEDHDLAALAARAQPAAQELGDRVATRLQRVIEKRRTKLQRKAFRLASDLYDRKPRRAVRL